MKIVFLIAVYFIVWWVVLFAVLPFGVRTQAEAGAVVPGTPESAPANFRLARVLLITTVVAGVVFAGLWAAVHWQLIDLYEWAQKAT
jgi:predicted secreted protein